MDFRVLLPHWLQGIGFHRADPHIRFKKRRVVSLSPSHAKLLQYSGFVLLLLAFQRLLVLYLYRGDWLIGFVT